jgi:hypothetical protein
MSLSSADTENLHPRPNVFSLKLTCYLLSIYAQNHLIQSDGREQSATVTHGGAAISKSIHINPALKVLVAIFQLEMRNPPQLASEAAA